MFEYPFAHDHAQKGAAEQLFSLADCIAPRSGLTVASRARKEAECEAPAVPLVRFLSTDFVQVLFEPRHISATRNSRFSKSLQPPY
jgi:hypothetical protein